MAVAHHRPNANTTERQLWVTKKASSKERKGKSIEPSPCPVQVQIPLMPLPLYTLAHINTTAAARATRHDIQVATTGVQMKSWVL